MDKILPCPQDSLEIHGLADGAVLPQTLGFRPLVLLPLAAREKSEPGPRFLGGVGEWPAAWTVGLARCFPGTLMDA